MKKHIKKAFHPLLILLSLCFLFGCVANKDTAIDRKFQNLTARYNYIYNSNVLLTEYNEQLLQTYVDNYEQILPVYLDPLPAKNLVLTPGRPDKQLDEVIAKGQTIINDKSFSNYIDDAYMLLGKANYLKENYFIASAYFDYTAKTYSNNLKTFIMAMNWKARSQMELNNMVGADKVLDTMLRALDEYKKDLAEPLATTAQMRIYQNRNKDAIVLLENAVRLADDKQLRIRWRYILAQLQQKEDDLQNAFINFTKVENSNAPFEMYFHANLQRIKIRGLISGYKVDEDKALLSLLKDDKNFDYTDQIYYQVGEMFLAEKRFDKAEENYLKSVKVSTKNQTQKALSYLRIADLNFKELNKYIKAKLYYDSTVLILPKTYPEYDNIAKKAENLQYLTDRYTIISKEDTAQTFAKLPESERLARVKSYLNKKIEAIDPIALANQSLNNPDFPNQNISTPVVGNGNAFYFNNSAAISNGFADFKKRWGNRPLEDNWRQSVRSSAQETNQVLAGGKVATEITPANSLAGADPLDQNKVESEYINSLPLSIESLNASNQKIIDAYFEIASFYQQELNDKNEAVKVYLELLRRFPENNHLAAIYYSLYLNYQGVDQNKANEYRQMVLSKFPESNFAKTILDPSFSAKQTEIENIAINNYNATFESYVKKDYQAVIKLANENIAAFPYNDFAPQYAYLKAIAIGRTNKLDALLTAFNAINLTYPNDVLITPLVRDHLKYIEANLEEFKQRPVALIDFDANEPRFVSQTQTIPVATKPLNTAVSQVAPPTEDKPVAKPLGTPVENKPENVVKPASVFSAAKSDEYYYVIDVADASLTLSSSRFGIGQFNRGNYPDNDLAHKLIELDNDQLIYVTSFIDLEDAKLYESSISGQLKNIMKVPANLYKGFIISKENFEKLTSRALINQYLEFLKDNYK
ncbi:type IX secretion system periplasmic lipoprotein PorW/SprE [Pedobacter sandarakinus]|uniref:type IX secretion system periplasmic lipoprotein PorW/SprE n=1 Tax=Pedobacter sandarakinus TaxID=353156 RepID=UPI0022465310|nr:gliding motility protein [Pedobacter sandarakinus]MCX2576044.1 gliding motility protein [Pedobacter sandarakinus]